MIAFFSDFGVAGPYLGQMEASVYAVNPDLKVINLFADAPKFNPCASAPLLAAYTHTLPVGSAVVAVVDPGVGTPGRAAVLINAAGRHYIGPDNGLFECVLCHDPQATARPVLWQPAGLSASFHGRDLFAPLAAHLLSGTAQPDWFGPRAPRGCAVSPDLFEVVYVDAYGNAITGIRAAGVAHDAIIQVNGALMGQASTYGVVAPGALFWYENSSGLVEIAVSRGSAARQLSLDVGIPVSVL